MNLKTKLKGKQYRLAQHSYDRTSVRFSKDNLKEVISNQGDSYQLEVIEKGRLGYASYNQPDPELLVEKALHAADFGDKVSYEYPKKKKLETVKLFSPEVPKITADDSIAVGKKIIKSMKEVDPDLLVDVNIDRSVDTFALEHSGGFAQQLKASNYSIGVNGELTSKGDLLSIDQSYSWRENNFNLKKFTDKLKQKFILSKKIVPVEGGKMTVVFAPEVVDQLFEFFETALSGLTLVKKVSKWQDSLNKEVADSRFSLIDDPLVDFAMGSTPFDDEGHAISTLPLIENGILKNYLFDLKNAAKMKVTPNGRGFGLPAHPATTNLIIQPGTKSKEEIIKSIKNGLFVEQVIGGGQDSPYAGDFTYNIHLGFLIKDGELTGRVKNCVVTGNIFEMIKSQLAEISSDTEWWDGNKSLPHISFENVVVIAQK